MKLYYKPGACSLAAHIVANEAGIAVELDKVDLVAKTTQSGGDYYAISPNGYVPALTLADGSTLTEASVVVQYLADQKPESGLMPAAGGMARYRAQQWLAFISTELHKNFSVFFKPGSTEEAKQATAALLDKRLAHVDAQLAGKTYLLGDVFSAADAYLWTVLGWTRYIGFDLSKFANIARYMGAVAARPAVQKTLAAEGLA